MSVAEGVTGPDMPGRLELVLATHGFATALAVADRAVILAGGRIVLDRPAAGLERDELHRLYDDLVETGETAPR